MIKKITKPVLFLVFYPFLFLILLAYSNSMASENTAFLPAVYHLLNPNGNKQTVVDQILEDIYKDYPDLPKLSERTTFSMPEELKSWESEDKEELETMIEKINETITNPYENLSSFVLKSRQNSQAISYNEPICTSFGPEYSSCIYTWTENDGNLEIKWIDTHLMRSEGGETTYTWQIHIAYKGVAANGEIFPSITMVVFDVFTAIHYPTTLIDTSWLTANYTITEPCCGLFDWSTYYAKYDSINKMHKTVSILKTCDCDSSLGYAHTSIRVQCEWPDEKELFDQPTYHWQTFVWDVGGEKEYLWIDYYIDMETRKWNYTIYDENGVVIGSGEGG